MFYLSVTNFLRVIMHHFFMFFCLVFSSTIEANTLYIFDKNGDPLKGAYIFFPEKNTYKNKTHIIKQKKYQFSPKVSVINKGDSVIFPNKDNFLHHIYSFSKTGVFEFYIEKGNNSPPFDFNTPGIAILGCNIHDTMAGFIHILEDEGFALSNRKGIVKFDTSLPDKL